MTYFNYNKRSILHRLYINSPKIIRLLIVKIKCLFGYRYCYTHGQMDGFAGFIDDYPMSIKKVREIKKYYKQNYGKHYYFEIIDSDSILR